MLVRSGGEVLVSGGEAEECLVWDNGEMFTDAEEEKEEEERKNENSFSVEEEKERLREIE